MGEDDRRSHRGHSASARHQSRHTLMDDDYSSFGGETCHQQYGHLDDVTVMEEGQEAMLIEELQQKMTMVDDDDDNDNNDNNNNNEKEQDDHKDSTCNNNDKAAVPGRKNKSRRKVQQVLLVPTSGDLLMERYRQAARRSKKARALLDHALNWKVSVANRDKLATEAFTEAGKARLLVEPNQKTP